LFNLAGITVWNYFTACLTGTSNTFGANAGIFERFISLELLYLSIVISNLIKFEPIILSLLPLFLFSGAAISLNMWTFYCLLNCFNGRIGLGLGMIISSLVTKYRDFSHLIGFGVQC
jgi:lipopolysaccharide transport system permease protein